MSTSPSPRALDHIGDLDKATGRVLISKAARAFIDSVFRTSNTALATAESGGDGKTVGKGQNYAVHADAATGVFPTGDPITDLVATFETSGLQVATRTMRGQLNSAAGTFTVTSIAATGAATTFILTGDGTDSVRVDVSYIVPGTTYANAVITFSAVDPSIAGGTPASGGGK